eukprot:3185297-Rhodomonas_salina.2
MARSQRLRSTRLVLNTVAATRERAGQHWHLCTCTSRDDRTCAAKPTKHRHRKVEKGDGRSTQNLGAWDRASHPRICPSPAAST